MTDKRVKDKYLLGSVNNALRVIDTLVENDEMGITEISKELKLGKTSIFRLLYTLKNSGYIKQNENNDKYYLSLKFSHIGATVLRRQNLVDIVHPYLEKLTKEHNETTHLVILDGSEAVFLDKANSLTNTIQMNSTVGTRMPSYCTGTGKLLLAYGNRDNDEEFLSGFKFKQFTNNTITDVKSLKEELINIRNKGYAEDDEEKEIGLTCYAVPIRNRQNKVVAGISISGPTVRMGKKKDELINSLMEVSKEISRLLG